MAWCCLSGRLADAKGFKSDLEKVHWGFDQGVSQEILIGFS